MAPSPDPAFQSAHETQPILCFNIFGGHPSLCPPTFVCHHHCTARVPAPPVRAAQHLFPATPVPFCIPFANFGCAPSSSCCRMPLPRLHSPWGRPLRGSRICRFANLPCTPAVVGAALLCACMHAVRERAPRRMRACYGAAPNPSLLTLEPPLLFWACPRGAAHGPAAHLGF